VSQDPLDLIYLDVWGPAPLLSSNNKHYFLYIVDDFSKYFWLLPLTCKYEVFNVFSQFKVMIEKYVSRSIKAIQIDGVGNLLLNQKFWHHMESPIVKLVPTLITKMAVLKENTGK
jgi:hypothetical protein